jgi:hypothetical protein
MVTAAIVGSDMIHAGQRRSKQLIWTMSVVDGASAFENYRQGIATGHATFENPVLDDWITWFASRLTAGRLVAEKDGWMVGGAAAFCGLSLCRLCGSWRGQCLRRRWSA